MTTKTEQKNLLCAAAIHQSVDILLNATVTEEQKSETRNNLKVIFKNVMPFLRNDPKALDITLNINAIDQLYSSVLPSPIRDISSQIGLQLGLSENTALCVTMPSLCNAIYKEICETEPQENSPWFERLCDVANLICRGEPLNVVSAQLVFINDILKVPTPDLSDNTVCETLTDTLLNDGGNFAFSRSLTEDFVYSIFHKIRLSELMEHYKAKNTKKANSELETLIQKHGTDNTDIFVDNPSYQQKKERSAFVKGLQKYTLETLILTKNFLESHGLRFYLTEGTLLGAVRHNGFIPWDDDIDIAMPREDYDRLVELAKQGKIPPELNFDSLETNPKHWVLGAKMQLVRKTPYIQHKVTKLSKCNGPYVDIFPIDYWDRPAGFKFAIANNCVKVARRLLFIKTGYSVATKKKPFRIIARILLPFVKNTWIEKFAIKNMKKFYGGNRKYSVNLCSYYPYYKEVFPTSFFGEPVYINFEGEQMPVPCDYDYMIKTVYGKNYDTIPPVRVTNLRKHAFELNKEVI